MRAATVAAEAGPGCARDFAQAAFREAFARGRDLGDPEVIAAAAGAAGIGPQIIDGIASPETKDKLRRNTEEAWNAGLQERPYGGGRRAPLLGRRPARRGRRRVPADPARPRPIRPSPRTAAPGAPLGSPPMRIFRPILPGATGRDRILACLGARWSGSSSPG